jgi:hypothetical protein
VKICSLYGAGFYYMPGTDTCIKIGGFVRAEVNFNALGSFTPINNSTLSNNVDSRGYNNNNWRSRGAITADARSQTAYGTLRAYVYLAATDDNSIGGSYAGSSVPTNGTGASAYSRLYAPAAFIQWAGFTMGKTGSFFDFDGQPYSNQSNIWSSNNGGNGVDLFAYTAQLGNGLSASIALESNNGHRLGIVGPGTGVTAAGVAVAGAPVAETAAGQSIPDIVGNLRIDQAWGSAQIMGAYHQVNFSGATAVPATVAAPVAFPSTAADGAPGSDASGWAFGAGVKVNLPMLGKGDYFVTQFTYGKGAIDYVGSGLAQSNNIKIAGKTAYAPAWDAVVLGGGNADLTTGWSITGGFEHFWVPNLKTSLYGAYGKLQYSAAASALLIVNQTGAAAGSSANWSYWQVGSRTTWTPVTNLDLSVEVMYNSQQSAFGSTATVGDNSWWSGIVRAQRNFYP